MQEKYSLQAKFPDIAKELHPTKNGDIKADEIPAFSNKEFIWLCPRVTDCGCSHEYSASASNRCNNGLTCPFKGCSVSPKKWCIHESILYTHPDIAKFWDTEKNKEVYGLESAADVTHGSSVDAFWKCSQKCPQGCEHSWQRTILSATRDRDCDFCPYCSGQKICEHTSLEALYPEIAKELHPTKNVKDDGQPLLASEIFQSAGIEVRWKCPIGCPFGCVHEYSSIVSNRTKLKQGCPFAGCCLTAPKLTCLHTSLAHLFPQLASEWHPTKNSISPSEVLPFCNDKVWWMCEKRHEWEAAISDRHRTHCPECNCWKNESDCREIIERLTGKKFPKTRSVFSDGRLELDGHCKELMAAFEYQGEQHFMYHPHFHRHDIQNFHKQVRNDEKKRQESVQLGIRVIEVSYLLKSYEEKEQYIREQLIIFGLLKR